MKRSVAFRCWGHRNLRASHHKTLELTREAEITSRATCVVGVRADFDPRQVAGLRGSVRVRLRHGERVEELEATVPAFVGVRPTLVLRRGDRRFGNTFAYGATASAKDLDRTFVNALRDSEAELRVEISELTEAAGALTLVALPVPRLEALDAEVRLRLAAVDAIAAERLGDLEPLAAGLGITELLALEAAPLLARLRSGERLALVSPVFDLGAQGVLWNLVDRAAAEGIPVAAVAGVPPWTACLAAGGLTGQGHCLDRTVIKNRSRLGRRLRALQGTAGATVLTDVRLAPKELATEVLSLLGERRLSILAAMGTADERSWVGTAAELATAGLEVPAPLVVAVAPGETGDLPTGLLRALLDEGVRGRTLARALAADTGWSRSQAYQAVLDLQHEDPLREPESGE
ncbi:MAG: DUF371 domain-containing protein [Acidobacteriota bacterium]